MFNHKLQHQNFIIFDSERIVWFEYKLWYEISYFEINYDRIWYVGISYD